MRLHVYSAEGGEPRTVPDADASRPLSEFIEIDEESFVFVVDEIGREVDITITLAEIFTGASGRVITHRGRRILVTVHYLHLEARLEVSPGTRLETIRERSIAELGIDPVDAADLGLHEVGWQAELPLDHPVASVAKGRNEVDLELTALVRPQG